MKRPDRAIARRAERRLRYAKHWLWKHFVGKHLQEREAALVTKANELKELEERVAGAVIDIDFGLSQNALASFEALCTAFAETTGAERIWDITAEGPMSVASHAPQMEPPCRSNLFASISSKTSLANANGADLLIYPAFVMMVSGSDFGLVDVREVDLAFKQNRFLETGTIPSDAVVVDSTWKKVNKNGTLDKRFKGNYRIPVVGYGELVWKSPVDRPPRSPENWTEGRYCRSKPCDSERLTNVAFFPVAAPRGRYVWRVEFGDSGP